MVNSGFSLSLTLKFFFLKRVVFIFSKTQIYCNIVIHNMLTNNDE